MFGNSTVIKNLIWRNEMDNEFLADYILLRENACQIDDCEQTLEQSISLINGLVTEKKIDTIVGQFKLEILRDY